jgi:hypothetical protein
LSLSSRFTIYQKYIKQKEEKKLCFSQSTFLQDHGASLWLEAVSSFALSTLLDFRDEVSWEFLWLFLLPEDFFFQRVSNRETEELTRSVDDLRRHVVRQMGLVTARNMAIVRAFAFQASIIPLSALIKRPGGIASGQNLRPPSLR